MAQTRSRWSHARGRRQPHGVGPDTPNSDDGTSAFARPRWIAPGDYRRTARCPAGWMRQQRPGSNHPDRRRPSLRPQVQPRQPRRPRSVPSQPAGSWVSCLLGAVEPPCGAACGTGIGSVPGVGSVACSFRSGRRGSVRLHRVPFPSPGGFSLIHVRVALVQVSHCCGGLRRVCGMAALAACLGARSLTTRTSPPEHLGHLAKPTCLTFEAEIEDLGLRALTTLGLTGLPVAMNPLRGGGFIGSIHRCVAVSRSRCGS
jgi:hypothetical protein